MKTRKNRAAGVVTMLFGLICALVLGALFYGVMVYQHTGAVDDGAAGAQPRGGVLALSGAQLLEEQTVETQTGGQRCTALVRTYQLQNSKQAEAITASPAAYLERISQEGWTPQLITGFVLAEMEAVYALRGEECLLAAREGDTVYMLRAAADEQAAYALGAQAYLETGP